MLLKKPSFPTSCFNSRGRFKFRYLSENLNLTIKGERLSLWTQQTNVKSCKIRLNNEKFFEQLGTNRTLSYAKEVKEKTDDSKNECVTKQKRLLG